MQVDPPNVTANISDPPVSIRQIDACDPWSLETNKEVNNSTIYLFYSINNFINDDLNTHLAYFIIIGLMF